MLTTFNAFQEVPEQVAHLGKPVLTQLDKDLC